MLLYLGKYGELRVILTKRSRGLRNFSGHVSFPGGKADNGLESEWDTATREAEEEIGLDLEKQFEDGQVKIEKLTTMPSYLARTLLAVRPCVGILSSKLGDYNVLDKKLKLLLNPGESSSVFSVPLRDFYDTRTKDNIVRPKELQEKRSVATKWSDIRWYYRQYVFSVDNSESEAEWIHEIADLSEDESDETPVRNVWGLTANILHDLAYILYKGQDYWKDRLNIGEEEMIYSLSKAGKAMQEGQRTQDEVKLINGTEKTHFFDMVEAQDVERLRKIYNERSKI